ncbi:GLE1-like protein-domain-containing protein, partial [Amylocystis lapponica]
IEDTVASIRLRVRHRDAYEEFEHNTKRDAADTAKAEHKQRKFARRRARREARSADRAKRAALHRTQLAEVEAQLAAVQLRREAEEQALRDGWAARSRRLWERLEQGIALDEEKERARLEEERKKREEEERKRQEEEEKRRQEEERQRAEEEERQRQREREEEEARVKLEEERRREEEERAEAAQRRMLGASTAFEDWKRARDTLRSLKAGPMKTVKSDKALKSEWSAARRQITPKIGQLTNDPQSIARISQEIMDIVNPAAHPPAVYIALLSSLSKTILLQAETEVTAEKRSAAPLAQVAANLLSVLNGFADVFWAKLCQRTGGWPVPFAVPDTDSDGTPFDDAGRAKALGERGEALGEHMTRVTGLLRVYFHILCAPVARPLEPAFRLPRFWTYFARMLRDARLLESPVAPQVLHAALDVGGMEARDVWGAQWVKMLAVLYEGVTTGLHGSKERLIGGQSSEGIAARVRCQLEIERIMGTY